MCKFGPGYRICVAFLGKTNEKQRQTKESRVKVSCISFSIHFLIILPRRISQDMRNCQERVTTEVQLSVSNYQLIAEYNQRSNVVTAFERTVALGTARLHSKFRIRKQMFLARTWMFLICGGESEENHRENQGTRWKTYKKIRGRRTYVEISYQKEGVYWAPGFMSCRPTMRYTAELFASCY